MFFYHRPKYQSQVIQSRALMSKSPCAPFRVFSYAAVLLLCGLGCEPAVLVNSSSPIDQEVTSFIPEEFDATYSDAYFDMTFLDDPCDPNPCEAGSQCMPTSNMSDQGMMFTCLSLSCDELQCPAGTVCEQTTLGSSCIAQACSGAEDCETAEFCDAQGECQTDICSPNERSCNGVEVMICNADGSELISWVTCPLGETQCLNVPQGEAACACIDDWECPEYMRCDRGRCLGRVEAPTCLLDPQPFSASLPTPEIIWGGNADNPEAVGSPLPDSSQVVMTPLVANLTDDNGDGLIDEGDIPEVIFMTFCSRSFSANGALRAIHGGGPNKGKDLFVTVGDQHWYEGQDINLFQPNCNDANLDPTAGIAVANLDPIGGIHPEPEIIGIHENDGLVIYNHKGEVITNGLINIGPNLGSNPTPSIAQLDGQGMAEVIVSRIVYTLARQNDEIVVLDYFSGSDNLGVNGQGGISCVADLDGDGQKEIVAGGSLYRFPNAPNGAQRTSDCMGNGGQILPQTNEEESWCQGELITIWTDPNLEGFCAVADIWGADPNIAPGPQNPLDHQPEVILISNGKLFILNGLTGERISQVNYGGSSDKGGAPNVGDFDGDGYPEVGSAFAAGYVMMDLQTSTEACPTWTELTVDEEENGLFGRPPRTPGDTCNADIDCAEGALCVNNQCICAHQGWRRSTEDSSSRVTGSTLFDFNGDGAVEVIYNDECFFRIYDGTTGMTLFRQASESRTRIEHPIVADVDADGNAEIIFSTSTESRFCSIRNRTDPFGNTYSSLYNPGIEVWGDPQDRWVSARKIWNQHAYHVTHVTESGDIPIDEPRGWIDTRGRSYNTYRAQPLSYGLAPDLLIEALRISSSRTQCGESNTDEVPPLNISVTVSNRGEVQVGSGIKLHFLARWVDGNNFMPLFGIDGLPLELFTTAPILPDTSQTLSITYRPNQDPTLPHRAAGVDVPLEVKAIIDPPEDTDFGRERECIEDNNERINTPIITDLIPDLSLNINSITIDFCPEINLDINVHNLGSAVVRNIELGMYLGDPRQGGSRIDSYTITEEIPAGGSLNIDWQSDRFPEYRSAFIYVMVDPANRINECDDNNNIDSSQEILTCQVPDGK